MSKRKAYRPKRLLINPLAIFTPASKGKFTTQILGYHVAIRDIESGMHPGPLEWASLADLTNVMETFVRRGAMQEADVIPHVMVATVAMKESAQRYIRDGIVRVEDIGLASLKALLGLFEIAVEGFNAFELALNEAETHRIVCEVRASGSATITSL